MKKAALATTLFTLVSPLALAHSGHVGESGFESGVMHPLNGVDHLSVMVAVGILAVMFGGSARIKIPLLFVAVMVAGWFAAITDMINVGAEGVIAFSVVALGGMLITGTVIPKKIATGIVLAFAVFHGLAHGVEMPFDAQGIYYVAGFVLSTFTLNMLGVALGESIIRIHSNRYVAKIIGMGMMIFGSSLFLLQ